MRAEEVSEVVHGNRSHSKLWRAQVLKLPKNICSIPTRDKDKTPYVMVYRYGDKRGLKQRTSKRALSYYGMGPHNNASILVQQGNAACMLVLFVFVPCLSL